MEVSLWIKLGVRLAENLKFLDSFLYRNNSGEVVGSVTTFGAMECKFEDLPTRKLRLRYFCNLVESLLLGKKRSAFYTESRAVSKQLTAKLPENNAGRHFDYRTWENWFHGELRRKKKLEEFADLKWSHEAYTAINEGETQDPFLNYLRSLDVLSVFVDQEKGRRAGTNKVTAAQQLILGIHKKWQPHPLGLIKIGTADLIAEDLTRPRHETAPDGRASDACDETFRSVIVPPDVVETYEVASFYNTLQFLQMILVNVDERCEVFHTLVLDIASCVVASYCLSIWDEGNVIGDRLARNKLEAIDAGMRLYFYSGRELRRAGYLLGVGHPWGKHHPSPNLPAVRSVVAARRSYIHILIRRGIAPKKIQEIIERVTQSRVVPGLHIELPIFRPYHAD